MSSLYAIFNGSNQEWRPTKSPPATPDDYFIAGAILFPIVIILLVANILMFVAVLDMIITNRGRESCAGPVLILNLAVSDCMVSA